MSKLERYPAYKDSGVEWLGEIPEHWQTQKMKYLGKMFAGLTDKKGDDFNKEISEDKKPFIPFTNVCNNVKIDSNQMQYVKVKPYEKQNKVQKNDIIFLMSSETLDDIGKCSIHLDEEQFYLNSFCKGFRPKAFAVNAEFLNYLLQSKTYRNYFALVGRGFTRINIKQEYINDLFTILPPKEEQTKIASFLDEKTSQIDKAISQKEKLIELLKERRQITINEAVTKGLDKDVEFKDSGVEWIGEIPKHWEVKKLKYSVKNKTIKSMENSFKIALENIESQTTKYIETKDIVFSEAGINFNKGDVLFGKLRPYLAKVYLAEKNGLCVSEFLVLEAKKINNIFLKFLLVSDLFIRHVNSSTYGTKMPRASWDFIGNSLIPIPTKSEQLQIVKHIETQTAKIDKAIELQQNYIAKLKEYKASLIDSVVTGKVRVD